MIEVKEMIRITGSEKAAGPCSLSVCLLKIDDLVILRHLHSIPLAVWREGELPQQRIGGRYTTRVLHKKEARSDCNYRGITHVIYAGKGILHIRKPSL